jgi:HEAT repeat protein
MARDPEALAAALSNEDVAVRLAAAEKIASLGESAADLAIPLVKALADENESVREFVTSALEDCGPPPQEDAEQLEQLLGASNADIAYWAATLLGRLGDGAIQAVEALRTAAAEHVSPEVRQRATWALGKIATG